MTLMEVRDNGRGITDAQIDNPGRWDCSACAARALGGEGADHEGTPDGTRLLVILPEGEAGA
jgi:hypothetical protein